MKYKAVIFDLDGVIVTTDDCHYQAWKQMADMENIYFDRQINERLRGVSRMESLEIILEKSQKEYSMYEKTALATYKNDKYKLLIEKLTRDDILCGVSSLFDFLKQNRVKIAIGSSSKNSKPILERIELLNTFDSIIDGNDIKNSKPDPEVFSLAGKRLGIAPCDCLVVEDAEAGVVAANAAGMDVLGVGSAENSPLATYHAKDLNSENVRKILI